MSTTTKRDVRTMSMDDPERWTAVRDGEVYCAPGCGAKCKHSAYLLAHERANALAKRLGPAWKTRVHENMGWHYSVCSPCGRIQVHEYWRREPEKADLITKIGLLVPDHYTAFLSDRGGGGGRWTATCETPEEAIQEVIETATAERDSIADMLTTLAPILPAAPADRAADH